MTKEEAITALVRLKIHISGGVSRFKSYIKNENADEAINMAISALEAQPEIIRCKDCKYVTRWRSKESARKFGQIYECRRGVFTVPKPDDFCSYAERRVDE